MAVDVRSVCKTFAGVRALQRVTLNIPDGDVTAVVGANGSGKSTLAKVLSGVYRPDSGDLTVGRATSGGFHSPSEATAAGVRIVHQEAPLVNALSVAEAMAMFSRYPTGAGGRIRWRELARWARANLEQLNVAIDPRQPCSSLSSAERALVSLAVALGAGAPHLLILDEVTAALTEGEAATYLGRMRTIAERGGAVMMVTHRLGELRYADRVVVLRDGQVVASYTGVVDEEHLIADMVGDRTYRAQGRISTLGQRPEVARLWEEDAKRTALARSATRAGEVLSVRGLCGSTVHELDLTVARGEIVGVAGLRGSGVDELPYLLTGNRSRRAGEVLVAGQLLPRRATPADARRLGISFLPADRLRQGGVAALQVSTNVILPDIRRFWHRPGRERAVTEAVIAALDVRPPSAAMRFGNLSGGNQQKVLLGKWLRLAPAVLILDDPTNGVDPGARRVLFEGVFEAARAGMGVLLLSSEPEQLVLHCERVLVLREGRLAHELRRGAHGDVDLTLDALTRWAYA